MHKSLGLGCTCITEERHKINKIIKIVEKVYKRNEKFFLFPLPFLSFVRFDLKAETSSGYLYGKTEINNFFPPIFKIVCVYIKNGKKDEKSMFNFLMDVKLLQI